MGEEAITMKVTPIRAESSRDYNWFERYALRRAHPRKLFFDSCGLLWAVYFLWGQDWVEALFSMIALSALGHASVWNLSAVKMAETTLGKIALLHLHPFNLVVQLAGIVPLIYGIWTHNTVAILSGISLIFIGHSFGWEKIDERFA